MTRDINLEGIQAINRTIKFRELEQLQYGRREAINALKTNIRFSNNDINTLAVVSCNSGEGKTTTSFELARIYAAGGSKVLLIDADMRKSVIKKRYNVEAPRRLRGLSQYLSGHADIGEIVFRTNVDNLYVVLSGNLTDGLAVNPTELLSGQLLDRLIHTCREMFDMIIIDTPPLGLVIDAAVIGSKCDGVIMLLEAASTDADVALGVKKQLEKLGCNILGCVLNKAQQGQGSYNYRNKYYKSYGYGKKGKHEW